MAITNHLQHRTHDLTEHDHIHGQGCGHRAVPHDDHLDYLHNGHWQAPHDEHPKPEPEPDPTSVVEGPGAGRPTTRLRCGCAAFAGLHYDIHHAIADGDLIAVNSTMNGRHVAPWTVL